MQRKRIVLVLGGNALGKTLNEQMSAIRNADKTIADLIEQGHEVIICHGNGPQVGMIQLAMNSLVKTNPQYSQVPLSVCVAMSQSYIGYDLQCLLREELANRHIQKSVTTIITQVEVDPEDEAFKSPTKPIGPFMKEAEAKRLAQDRGWSVKEDSGRGWRRVVASPNPVAIVELETIKSIIDAEQIVIACGGGGIPVVREGNHLRGAKAVIDKDLASEKLAEAINADYFIILTSVENAAINFGKPNQKNLGKISCSQAKEYCEQGHFAKGSMLPKIKAAISFAGSAKGRLSLITHLEKAHQGIRGETGTMIVE